MNTAQLGVRWTLGDVGERGFEALRLSLWGAHKIFGPQAAYAVCVNTIPVSTAQAKTGAVPPGVVWHDATGEVPAFLKAHFDEGMAEGVGWKLAPMRFFPDRYELSLDNDVILWDVPPAIQQWLTVCDNETCVAAEDVAACFGVFAEECGTEPRNGGIRGLPPGYDLEAAMRTLLARHSGLLTSETDEQGLQTAALCLHSRPLVVSVADVTICSPFYPHLPYLGQCGAHFVGLNCRHIPWNYYDRPADELMTEHWQRYRDELYTRTGAPRN